MIKYNIELKGKHVPGANNIICDRISLLIYITECFSSAGKHEFKENSNSQQLTSTKLPSLIERDIKCAVAASTYRNYEKHWSGFKTFCSETCNKHISGVREKHAVLYVAYSRHVKKS